LKSDPEIKGLVNWHAAEGILAEYQLKMVVDHYNEANPGQKQIQLILDLTEDVAEMEAGGNPEEGGIAA
jgi:hypothetical protein